MNGQWPVFVVAIGTFGAVAIGVLIGTAIGVVVGTAIGVAQSRRFEHRSSTRSANGKFEVESELEVSPEVLAEADAELGQRLSSLAHDIRSLLGPILGYAELIKSSSSLEQARSHATKILKAGGRVEKLADDLRGTAHDRSKAAERLDGSGSSVGADRRNGR